MGSLSYLLNGGVLLKFRIVIRRIIVVFIIISLIFFGVSHYDSKQYSIENEEDYVTKICKMGDVQGTSIAISNGGKEYFINYSAKEERVINEQSLFELGSTTKAFTALGILQLKEEGKINLTDSVDKYLPWFNPTFHKEKATITIDNLLKHTSGIPAWTIDLIPEGTSENNTILTQTIKTIKDINLNNEPGSVHEYATINYDVLALIIEGVTGQKYADYINENVLIPLGMNDSFFRENDECSKEIQGYKVGFLQSREYDAPTYYGNTAAGYLVSNTSDLMKWMKSVNTLFDFDNYEVTDTINYYAGWNIYEKYVCHAGNNPNFSSQIIISRDNKLKVFALSNLSGSSATKIADGIYRMHLGEKIRIGFYIDGLALVDYICLISILLMIYFMLLIQIKSFKRAIVNIIIALILLGAIIVIPQLLHYSIHTLMVWCPISLMVALILSVLFAIFEIYRSVIWMKKNKEQLP